MTKYLLRSFLALMAAVVLSGCGVSPNPSVPDPNAAGPGQQQGGTSQEAEEPPPPEVNLAELLAKPRAELAALAENCAGSIRAQEQERSQLVPFEMLKDLIQVPLSVPVLHQAKFSEQAGFSLPPYCAAGTKDNALALHLARHGDYKAALELADPTDAHTVALIETFKLERNYPVEWTRLVGLLLHRAEYHVAAGDKYGVRDIIQIHKQLHEVLDSKARTGALGAALLARGRGRLQEALAPWRHQNGDEEGDQIAAALKDWGPVPALVPAVAPGQSRAEVARLCGDAGKGRALGASSIGRALDLIGVPLPPRGVEGVAAVFDADDRLVEVLVSYRSRIMEEYPRPTQLAHLLEEHAAGQDLVKGDGLVRRVYALDKLNCEVVMVPRNPATGALVRLAGAAKAPAPPTLPRDLGAFHLNRSYEENRLRLARNQAGKSVTIKDAKSLAQLRLPFLKLAAAEAVLEREAGDDVVARLAVSLARSRGQAGLVATALPLWQSFGPARIFSAGVQEGKHLALVWEDAQTRYALRLPNMEEELPYLEVSERTDQVDLRARAERTRDWDRAEREARFAEQKLLTRLPRELEGLHLGDSRAEVLAALPGGDSTLKREIPSGLLITFTTPPVTASHAVRELFARFRGGRLAEVRVRYTDGPNKSAGGVKRFLESLINRFGAPVTSAGTGARVWSDMPASRVGSWVYRWRDDTTLLTCQQDGAGIDLILRERPKAEEPVRPLAYLPRGAENCTLGMSRADLLKRWGVSQPKMSGHAIVLLPEEPSPYDVLLVWCDGDRVVRVVGRHRQPNTLGSQVSLAARAVTDTWSRHAAEFGWPRRQDASVAGALQSWSNYDDLTRVRLFWQQNQGESLRLYAEWKELAGAGAP